MARYYFHLNECGAVTIDEEGLEFAMLSSALKAGRTAALAIMADEVLHGKLCLSCSISIEHGPSGERVDVPFRDLLVVTGV